MNTPLQYQRPTGLARLPDVFDRLFRDTFVVSPFDQVFNGVRMNANLLETADAYIVQLVVPGIKDVRTLQIQVVGNQLTVKGVMEIPVISDATYIYQGLEGSEFSESFTLPAEVDGEKAFAEYVLGILTINLPKAEHAKPHTVKVSTVH